LRPPKRNQRGIALITVLIAITITLVISNEFGTSTNVDIGSAANYRDQMRAHFLARSAQNLAELVVRIQQRLDNIKELQGQVQITDYADQLILPFCGDSEQVRDMIGISTDQVKGMGAEIGTCGFDGPFTTEDNKINLNCANAPGATPAVIKSVLDGLLYFQAYDPVFEEADAEGWRRDRAQQADAIMDYIDTNSMRGSNRGTSEDYGYESLKDHYLPKNNNIDTLGEVKLVRGVDDRFWSLFGTAFTVYGGCKINLAAVTNVQLIASVLYLSAKNPNDPVLQDQRKLFLLASIVARAKQMGETFTKADEFIQFVKDPTTSLSALASSGGMAGSAASSALTQGLGLQPGEKIGMELDAKNLNAIAAFGPRRTYRIEAYGEIERKQKRADGQPVFPPIRATINGVWDTKVFPQNSRKPALKGAWVFLRED
jgi:general secretion pathway protein K